MKASTRYVAGAGLAVGLYLLLRNREPSGTVGQITVVKNSSECDPSSAGYKGAAYCTASSDPVSAIGDAATDAADSVKDALTNLWHSITRTGDRGFTPTVAPKTTDAGVGFASKIVPGGDGPVTRPLQQVSGLGSRIAPRGVDWNLSSRIGHQ